MAPTYIRTYITYTRTTRKTRTQLAHTKPHNRDTLNTYYAYTVKAALSTFSTELVKCLFCVSTELVLSENWELETLTKHNIHSETI